MNWAVKAKPIAWVTDRRKGRVEGNGEGGWVRRTRLLLLRPKRPPGALRATEDQKTLGGKEEGLQEGSANASQNGVSFLNWCQGGETFYFKNE